MRVVLNSSSNEYVRISGYFHFVFAHPSVTILFISSIVSFRPPAWVRHPIKSAMDPFRSAALTMIRPSGSLSASTCSPGLTPRCFSRSRFKVTCPFEVTVSVVMEFPFIRSIVRHYCLTVQCPDPLLSRDSLVRHASVDRLSPESRSRSLGRAPVVQAPARFFADKFGCCYSPPQNGDRKPSQSSHSPGRLRAETHWDHSKSFEG